MNNLGKIFGILSGILSAVIIFVLGIEALQMCLSLSGSSVVVVPSTHWFSQLSVLVSKYGLYLLLILSLSQIFVGKTKNGSGILFIIYAIIVVCFVAVIFFPEEVIKLLK